MIHKLLNNDKALKFCKLIKSFKKIAETAEFKNFFIVDDEIFCELFSTLLLKMLSKTDSQALIVIKKQSIDKLFKNFIINLIEIKASATISTNKKFFYTTKIKTKLKLTHSQDVKKSAFIDQHLTFLKLSCLMLWWCNWCNIFQVEKFNSNFDFDDYILI